MLVLSTVPGRQKPSVRASVVDPTLPIGRDPNSVHWHLRLCGLSTEGLRHILWPNLAVKSPQSFPTPFLSAALPTPDALSASLLLHHTHHFLRSSPGLGASETEAARAGTEFQATAAHFTGGKMRPHERNGLSGPLRHYGGTDWARGQMSWLFIQEPSIRPPGPSPVLGSWAAPEAPRNQEADQRLFHSQFPPGG